MKSRIKKKWKWLLILGLIFIIIIPLLINWGFKNDFGIEMFRAQWDAGDALSFYGSVLAAILAILGVFVTIENSQKNYSEDIRRQVLPFFSVCNLKTKANRSWLHSSMVENGNMNDTTEDYDGYIEYKVKDYCYILENGKITIKDGLSEEQKRLLNSAGFKWITIDGVNMCVKSDHICHPMEIENVGKGAAISFRIGLNREETKEKDRQYTYGVPIKVGEKIMIHIFSEDCGIDSPNLGIYFLEFRYQDIYGNKYSQNHEIKLAYSQKDNWPVISIRFEEEQHYLKKNNTK